VCVSATYMDEPTPYQQAEHATCASYHHSSYSTAFRSSTQTSSACPPPPSPPTSSDTPSAPCVDLSILRIADSSIPPTGLDKDGRGGPNESSKFGRWPWNGPLKYGLRLRPQHGDQ
jgi:hypothetical protein